MNKAITYSHKNGYSAKLYGKSSMSIYYDGKEVMHTGFRNVNTEDEVMELLEDYPSFREQLEKHFDEIFEDDNENDI